MKEVFVAGLLLLSAGSMADEWIRGTKVVDVRWYGSSGYISTGDTTAPEVCGDSPNGNRYFSDQTTGYKEFLSMGLAAMMAGKTVDVLINSCAGDHNIIKGLIVNSN